MKKNEVILVFAGEEEKVPRLPMSILTLGAFLRDKGFKPILIDLRLGFSSVPQIDWDNVLCVGMSAMSGPPLLSGLKFSKLVRSKDKEIPIVWGGPHASFFPKQTLENQYVDFVIKNEGEMPLLELLSHLQGKGELENIKGLTYMKSGKPHSNQDAGFIDLEEVPLPAYDLLDMDKYLQETGNNISYESSRGCPHRCTFCYVHFFHKFRWRSKSVKKVLSDLKAIVEAYNPKDIKFVEDNFFVNKARVLELAQAFIDEGFKFSWDTTCRADYLSRYTLDELKLLRKSGCVYVSLGVESGSNKILQHIKKDITKDQVRQALKNCLAADIMPVVSLIVGLPGESRRDINDTLDFYDEMLALDPARVEINAISIYSPYPGTPMFDEACKLGYEPFSKLEEWAVWQVDDPRYVPWYSKAYRKNLDLISSISRYNYFVHRLNFYPKTYRDSKLGSHLNRVLYRLFVPLFSLDAKIRWKFRLFSNGFEWKLFDIARSKIIKAK